MSLFHRHVYREVQRVFTGRAKLGPCEGSAEIIMEMLMGVTTVISRCECGKVYTIKVLGDARIDAASDAAQIDALNRMMK